jgi:hypothetical protein
MSLSLTNMLSLWQVYISHIWHVIYNFSLCTIFKSPLSPSFAKQIMSLLLILCYNGSLVTWTVISLAPTKFEPLIFSTDCSKSQSCVTTDGQSTNLSWCQAPICSPRPDFYCSQTVVGLLMWGALSIERMGLLLQILLVFASTVILGSESCGTHDHILLPQIWDYPNLEGQVPVFISPRNRVAQLYPQALSSHFFTSYHSQGYGGGIGTRLHAGVTATDNWSHL